jgi:hypothetical protein
MDIFAFDSPGSRKAAAEPIPHTEPQQASAAGFGTAGRCGDGVQKSGRNGPLKPIEGARITSSSAGEGAYGPRKFPGIKAAWGWSPIMESDSVRINSCPDTCTDRGCISSDVGERLSYFR